VLIPEGSSNSVAGSGCSPLRKEQAMPVVGSRGRLDFPLNVPEIGRLTIQQPFGLVQQPKKNRSIDSQVYAASRREGFPRTFNEPWAFLETGVPGSAWLAGEPVGFRMGM
jgi:hypothetical protein